MKKIELNVLLIILIEAGYLLLFFNYGLINTLLGIILGNIFIHLIKYLKKNSLIRFLIILSSICLYPIFLFKTADFITYNILKSYSSIIIILSLIMFSIIIAKNGYHSFIKTCEIIFYLIIILKILSFILTIPLINIKNITINYSFDYQLFFIAFFILYIYLSIYYLSDYKISNKIISISFINPLYLKLISILVMGNKLINLYKYPYISYLKSIKYFDFIERVEGILSFEYLFCFIILLSYLLLNIKKSQ